MRVVSDLVQQFVLPHMLEGARVRCHMLVLFANEHHHGDSYIHHDVDAIVDQHDLDEHHDGLNHDDVFVHENRDFKHVFNTEQHNAHELHHDVHHQDRHFHNNDHLHHHHRYRHFDGPHMPRCQL